MTDYGERALIAVLRSDTYQVIAELLGRLIDADDQAPNTMLETLQKERARAAHLARLYNGAFEHYRHLQATSRGQEVAE